MQCMPCKCTVREEAAVGAGPQKRSEQGQLDANCPFGTCQLDLPPPPPQVQHAYNSWHLIAKYKKHSTSCVFFAKFEHTHTALTLVACMAGITCLLLEQINSKLWPRQAQMTKVN